MSPPEGDTGGEEADQVLRRAGVRVTYPDQGGPYLSLADARHGNVATAPLPEPLTPAEAEKLVKKLRAELKARAKAQRADNAAWDWSERS